MRIFLGGRSTDGVDLDTPPSLVGRSTMTVELNETPTVVWKQQVYIYLDAVSLLKYR